MAGRFRIVVVLVAFALGACGWTQYAGNAGRTGWAEHEDALTVANAAQARVLWTGAASTGEVAIAGGQIYGGPGRVGVWPVTPTPSCSGTPLQCNPRWWAAPGYGSGFSDPVVDGDTLYLAHVETTGLWHLSAYDVHAPCTTDGSPGCSPIWTGNGGIGNPTAGPASVAVAGGRVFVSGDGAYVTAFDAAGRSKCGGTPKVCQPLFQVAGAQRTRPIAVDGNRLLLPVADGIEVVDLTAAALCPFTCIPGYKLSVTQPGEVAAEGGVAYTTSGSRLLAFDDTGATGCSGAPTTCQPMWRGTLAAPANGEAPVVTGTRVYADTIATNGVTAVGGIEAFSRDPSACTGTPVTCTRTFMTQPGSTFARARVSASAHLLVVASVTSPNPSFPSPAQYRLDLFDIDGITGCNGQHRCAPVASLDLGQGPPTDPVGLVGKPALGEGLVVVPLLYDRLLVVGLP